MVYYKEYFQALIDAFSAVKKQCEHRKDELEQQYRDGETRLKGRFQTKMAQLHSETDTALEEIDKEITTLRNGKDSDSLGSHLRELRETRDNLLQQYNELARLAEEKSRKRSEVRGSLFKFWWQ